MKDAPLLFATGGTGGHIYPALAVAQEAKLRGYRPVFLGQKGGMEEEVVKRAGHPFYGVRAGKWMRGNPNPLEALRAGQGLMEALYLVRKLGPQLVVGFGGFASFPGVAAAKTLGIPYVLNEQNAYPGAVTRWFARGATTVLISDLETRKHLAPNVISQRVGYPVRETRLDKREARRALKLPEEGWLTFVMGGSQGSLRLNERVPEARRVLGTETSVLHSSGPRWETQLRAQTRDISSYFTSGFVDATLAWSAADLAITRAGFGTLAEAAFHAVPLIMVPLPSAADNHQLHNARAVAKAGAGWLVEERDLASLSRVWQQALNDSVLAEASMAASSLSPEGAARAFMNATEDVLRLQGQPAKQETT